MFQVLYKNDQLLAALENLAEELNHYCVNKEWLAICIMNGGLVFTGHILPRLSFDLRQDFIRVSRYGNSTSGGDLIWHVKPETSMKGKHILLFDDIFDEGRTLKAVTEYCQQQGAREIVSAVLIEKLHDRKVGHFRPNFVGLTCPDVYVYGFGMDYNGLHRNLQEIRIVTE